MRSRAWRGILLVAAVGLALGAWPGSVVLSVVDLRRGQEVLCAAMTEDEDFVLRFVHSVNRRPVLDTLRAARDHMVIVKSHFDAFGAGMPEASTDQGEFRVLPDSTLEWIVNRAMPEVVVRVGRVANHTLILKGREIPLNTLAEPGSPLALRGQTRSRLDLWKGRCVR
jgi:hypothetical protein